jgi:hypothetical protein
MTRKPACLEECYPLLKDAVGADGIKRLKAMDRNELGSLHFSLGMWIRNQWVHGGSPMRDRLESARVSVAEGDEISRLIIEGFWRHLRGEEFNLVEALRRHHVRSWRGQSETGIAGVLSCG